MTGFVNNHDFLAIRVDRLLEAKPCPPRESKTDLSLFRLFIEAKWLEGAYYV
jgi:hypothetical protein